MSDLKKYRILAERVASKADFQSDPIYIGDYIDANDSDYVLSMKFVEDQKELGSNSAEMLWDRKVFGPRQEYLINKNRLMKAASLVRGTSEVSEQLEIADKNELAAFEDALSDKISVKLNQKLSNRLCFDLLGITNEDPRVSNTNQYELSIGSPSP